MVNPIHAHIITPTTSVLKMLRLGWRICHSDFVTIRKSGHSNVIVVEKRLPYLRLKRFALSREGLKDAFEYAQLAHVEEE